MSTRIPWPTARKAVPMAAVVFPFPGPVFTMIRPRRTSVIRCEGLILLERTGVGGQWSVVSDQRNSCIISVRGFADHRPLITDHFFLPFHGTCASKLAYPGASRSLSFNKQGRSRRDQQMCR